MDILMVIGSSICTPKCKPQMIDDAFIYICQIIYDFMRISNPMIFQHYIIYLYYQLLMVMSADMQKLH